MTGVTIEEAAEISAAEHEGEGWALRGDVPNGVREGLASKGLIRLHLGRWQLTPLGFTYTAGV